MIKPDTISSMRPSEEKDTAVPANADSQKPQPLLLGSTNKKLSLKASKTDQVLTYLKNSVSTTRKCPSSFFFAVVLLDRQGSCMRFTAGQSSCGHSH